MKYNFKERKVDNLDAVGILAAYAVEKAIVNAVKQAHSAYGYKAYQEIRGNEDG